MNSTFEHIISYLLKYFVTVNSVAFDVRTVEILCRLRL
jgi:hypothetical protein